MANYVHIARIYKIVIIGIRNIWKVGNGILSGETKTKARARIL